MERGKLEDGRGSAWECMSMRTERHLFSGDWHGGQPAEKAVWADAEPPLPMDHRRNESHRTCCPAARKGAEEEVVATGETCRQYVENKVVRRIR